MSVTLPRLELPFEAVIAVAQAAGLAGVNVALPYKERVVLMLQIVDPLVAQIGAINTGRFAKDGVKFGHNTDCCSFVSAYRKRFSGIAPGRVALFGAAGVGRALAFGLLALKATRCPSEAIKLVTLQDVQPVDGVINATPIGMIVYPGNPLAERAFPAARWAFDAVYTPADTLFRTQAINAAATFLSGLELFFHQGIDAFEIFTNRRPPAAALRAGLGGAPEIG